MSKRIVITIEGGCLQHVLSGDPEGVEGVEVVIVDYDVDGNYGDAVEGVDICQLTAGTPDAPLTATTIRANVWREELQPQAPFVDHLFDVVSRS